MTRYQEQLRALLTPAEWRVFERLNTPQKIQDYLDKMPVNVLADHEHTMRSPREVLKVKKAHCMEGAMLAAAALAYHGHAPLLLDLATDADDYDHIVAVFTHNGRWGAISKTNYPVLRWRDPVYLNPRELAMSYFNEYFLDNGGRKTLVSYSKPFDLRKFDPKRWVVASKNVDWLAEALGRAPHFPIAPAKHMKALRPASPIERRATRLREWTRGGKRK